MSMLRFVAWGAVASEEELSELTESNINYILLAINREIRRIHKLTIILDHFIHGPGRRIYAFKLLGKRHKHRNRSRRPVLFRGTLRACCRVALHYIDPATARVNVFVETLP